MKVLFLDIDGVVNCASTTQRHRGAIGIDPYMAFIVGKIQLDTGCEVVLSSTWRHWDYTRAEVRKQVVEFIDVTPDSKKGFRGDEVKAWLANHPEVTRYAILDDDSDFHQDQPLFKTTWKEGITEAIAKNVTRYLNGDIKCLMCDQIIGDAPMKEVTTLKRFGQMLFEHSECPKKG